MENKSFKLNNNGKSSDYESVYKSSDAEYDNDSSVSHGFSSKSEIDFDNFSYDTATNPVTQAPDLGKLTQTHGTKLLSQRMDTNFQFDSSVGRVFQIMVRVGGGAKTEILLGK